MARWIAFDQETAAELRTHLPKDAVFEAPGRAALEYALNTSRPVVAVLEPEVGDGLTLAVFRATLCEPALQPAEAAEQETAEPVEPSAPVRESSQLRASGFLGLSDDYVGVEEEENTDKKRWWQFWR